MTRTAFACAAGLWLAVAGGTARLPAQSAPAYAWGLPSGLPPPAVPADNPMSEALVELGRHLFYDTRLSANGTQSCGTCHEQARAFTDGRAHSIGSSGEPHPRGSMSLVNVAFAATLTWANPTLTRLEDQALVPMYGDAPMELGLTLADDAGSTRCRRDAVYQRLLPAAFPASGADVTRENVVKALPGFERGLCRRGRRTTVITSTATTRPSRKSAKRGEVLFHSRPLSCFTCHGGVHFSNAMGALPAAE